MLCLSLAKLYCQIPCKDSNEAQLDGEKKTALLTGLAVNKAESNCRLPTECAPDAPFCECASDLMARKGMNPQQLGRATVSWSGTKGRQVYREAGNEGWLGIGRVGTGQADRKSPLESVA